MVELKLINEMRGANIVDLLIPAFEEFTKNAERYSGKKNKPLYQLIVNRDFDYVSTPKGVERKDSKISLIIKNWSYSTYTDVPSCNRMIRIGIEPTVLYPEIGFTCQDGDGNIVDYNEKNPLFYSEFGEFTKKIAAVIYAGLYSKKEGPKAGGEASELEKSVKIY